MSPPSPPPATSSSSLTSSSSGSKEVSRHYLYTFQVFKAGRGVSNKTKKRLLCFDLEDRAMVKKDRCKIMQVTAFHNVTGYTTDAEAMSVTIEYLKAVKKGFENRTGYYICQSREEKRALTAVLHAVVNNDWAYINDCGSRVMAPGEFTPPGLNAWIVGQGHLLMRSSKSNFERVAVTIIWGKLFVHGATVGHVQRVFSLVDGSIAVLESGGIDVNTHTHRLQFLVEVNSELSHDTWLKVFASAMAVHAGDRGYIDFADFVKEQSKSYIEAQRKQLEKQQKKGGGSNLRKRLNSLTILRTASTDSVRSREDSSVASVDANAGEASMSPNGRPKVSAHLLFCFSVAYEIEGPAGGRKGSKGGGGGGHGGGGSAEGSCGNGSGGSGGLAASGGGGGYQKALMNLNNIRGVIQLTAKAGAPIVVNVHVSVPHRPPSSIHHPLTHTHARTHARTPTCTSMLTPMLTQTHSSSVPLPLPLSPFFPLAAHRAHRVAQERVLLSGDADAGESPRRAVYGV